METSKQDISQAGEINSKQRRKNKKHDKNRAKKLREKNLASLVEAPLNESTEETTVKTESFAIDKPLVMTIVSKIMKNRENLIEKIITEDKRENLQDSRLKNTERSTSNLTTDF